MSVPKRIAVVLEIIGPVEDGEIVPDGKGGTFQINNLRQNKFWAAPIGHREPKIMVCIDRLHPPKKELCDAIAGLVEAANFIYD